MTTSTGELGSSVQVETKVVDRPKDANELVDNLTIIRLQIETAKEAARNEDDAYVVKPGNKPGVDKSLKIVETSIKKAITACKANPDLIPKNLDSTNAQIVHAIVDKVSEVEISSVSSPYVCEILLKALKNEIDNPLKVIPIDDLRFLGLSNPGLHSKIVDSFAQIAQQRGADSESIDLFKAEVSGPPQGADRVHTGKRLEARGRGVPQWGEDIGEDLGEELTKKVSDISTISQFLSTEKDLKLILALYDNNEFVNYVERTIDSHRGLSGEALSRQVNKAIEEDVVLLISKIFRRIDERRATEYFDEIITQGFFSSIQSVYNYLTNQLRSRTEAMKVLELHGKLPSKITQVDFFRRFSVETYDKKEVQDSKGEKKTIYYRKISPAPGKEKVKFGDFLKSVEIQVEREFEMRKYLHNVRAIFLKSAGKDGFWPMLASYADQMTAVDIDTINLLPDSDIFMTAMRLYIKHLEQNFATVDWIHQPNMFAYDIENYRTKIEQEIRKIIEVQYGDKVKDDIWRLDRAMTVGLALARGVYLAEPEIAAWADPPMNRTASSQKNRASYASYGTNDSVALNALNPMHTLMRWRSEGVLKGPILFVKTDGYSSKFTDTWNHRELWDLFERYENTFNMGKGVLHPPGDNSKLFIELLPNIARVGGLLKRSGWRSEGAYDGWLQHYENGVDLKYLESWKSLENIGFETLLSFVNDKILTSDEVKVDLLAPSSSAYKQLIRARAEKEVDLKIQAKEIPANQRKQEIEKRANIEIQKIPDKIRESEQFFRYIYKKYIVNPDVRGKQNDVDRMFGIEMDKLRKEVGADIDKKIKAGEISRSRRDFEVEMEVNKKLLFKALAGVLRNRIPTKFIRIDRDRFEQDGYSLLKKLQKEIGWDQVELDQAMKDVELVETQLRIQVSDKMKDYLSKFADPKNVELYGVDPDYVVNEGNIKSILKEFLNRDKNLTEAQREERLEKAVKVFDTMSKSFLNGESFLDDFAEKIKDRNKHLPFSIAPEEIDTYFYSYRAAGQMILKRLIGDLGLVETNVFKPLQDFMEGLNKVATSQEHDLKLLLEPMEIIKKAIESIHGPDNSSEIMFDMAQLVVAYFKKDTLAKNYATKWLRTGEFNNLAAMFAGGNTRVWQWDTADIDNFYVQLEQMGLLRKFPFDLTRDPHKLNKEDVTVDLFGKQIKIRSKNIKRPPDFKFNSQKGREQMGAGHGHIVWEMVQKYLPIFLIFLFWTYMSKAFKEQQGGGERK